MRRCGEREFHDSFLKLFEFFMLVIFGKMKLSYFSAWPIKWVAKTQSAAEKQRACRARLDADLERRVLYAKIRAGPLSAKN